MSEQKRAGMFRKLLDKMHNVNTDEYSPSADNNARLDYAKGNIDQNKPKNTDVWDTCPVLDETGKPVKEEGHSS
ncbi:MAG: hypothetical protein GXZ04_01015 [Clostridiales bacterium]|nr:hypothetical protein [Clostridiales bacterium]